MRPVGQVDSEWPLRDIHQKWAGLMAEEYRLGDATFRSEALDFARQMMRRAGDQLKRIVEELSHQGYRFVNPQGPVHAPEVGIAECCSELRHRSVHVPIALEAWLAEVGGVDLTGSHPAWSRPGYSFDDAATDEYPILTDAFVCVVPQGYLENLYDEWIHRQEIELFPFRIDFSPDDLHKANISGGPPYELSASIPAIDSLVLNERHCTTFVGHLRYALRWRGFPGFENLPGEGEWSTIQPESL